MSTPKSKRSRQRRGARWGKNLHSLHLLPSANKRAPSANLSGAKQRERTAFNYIADALSFCSLRLDYPISVKGDRAGACSGIPFVWPEEWISAKIQLRYVRD